MADTETQAYGVDTIASLLMLTERRVQQLAAEGVIPRADRGQYQLVGSIRGYIKYLQDRALPPGVGSIDRESEKVGLIKAQRRHKELEVAELEGELVRVDDVIRLWGDLIVAVRGRLLAFPTSMGPELQTATSLPEVIGLLRTSMENILDDLSNSHGVPEPSKRPMEPISQTVEAASAAES